jgi:hypothetical protein
MSTLEPSDTPEFYTLELGNAFKEQISRVDSYDTPTPVGIGATASVRTLEGEVLMVSLTLRGYQVRAISCLTGRWDSSDTQAGSRSQWFETLDDLLRAHSPQWTAKTQDILLDKLQRLSEVGPFLLDIPIANGVPI